MNVRQILVLANRAAAIGLVMLLCAACHKSESSQDTNRGPVSGKVTLDGNPLPGGSITFFSAIDKQNRVTALIRPQGEFAVAGAPLGKVQVTVETDSFNANRKKDTPKLLIPEKYRKAETSGLTAEIGPKSREGITIELQSK
jgi:hypothetical protein